MKWIKEPCSYNPKIRVNVLQVDAGDSIVEVYKEFANTVLSMAAVDPALKLRQKIRFDLVNKQLTTEPLGEMRGAFADQTLREIDNLERFRLRSEAYTCIQEDDEEDPAYETRLLQQTLTHYRLLKAGFENDELKDELARVEKLKPLKVSAGTNGGWWDLMIGSPDRTGPLSQDDLDVLDGKEPAPVDYIANLTGGMLRDLKFEKIEISD